MKKKNRKSLNYQATIDFSDINDMLWLSVIREEIRNINKTIRKVDTLNPLRVRLALRNPIEKQTTYNRFTGKSQTRGYDWGGNVIGGIKNARGADVYIYSQSTRAK